MTFDSKYLTVVIVSIILVGSMMWVINIETSEKMAEMGEIRAGPRGDIVFKSRCGMCHSDETPGKGLDAGALRSFIQLPTPPMVEWDGTPEELDVLIEYIQAGGTVSSDTEGHE